MPDQRSGACSRQSLRIGFTGLGVMGEPMCRNLVLKKTDRKNAVQVYDLNKEPMQRLVDDGAVAASSIADMAAAVDVLLMSLPGGSEVEAVMTGPDGILAHARESLTIVDLSTSPVGLTRKLAQQALDQGIDYADAPVARTRAAAVEGTLAIMVGAEERVYQRIQPLLACMASDLTHCGAVGAGQTVKILNNMVLFQTVASLAEALTLARRSGLDGQVLFDALKQGSADSFALRNHGEKALLSGEFPLQAFSTRYATKDLDYALQLAEQTDCSTPGATMVKRLFEQTIDAGHGDEYWPALLHVIESNQR
ncbi:MAG: NAD(P)-dependent oxidoreductase [Granulosicoccus sp.]|nr:NAD(P)-dependent oxidoreductase [Granulosicoccus sp.]